MKYILVVIWGLSDGTGAIQSHEFRSLGDCMAALGSYVQRSIDRPTRSEIVSFSCFNDADAPFYPLPEACMSVGDDGVTRWRLGRSK